MLKQSSARTDPDKQAEEIEQKMTDDERFSLLISVMGATTTNPIRDNRIPDNVLMSAGYTPGIPRLGIPALKSSDASLGITNPGYRPDDKGATALPASILVASSFNPQLAREGGALIAREARLRGLNIVLAGGINLHRDVRNGRNFEYYSEDPWLTAIMGAEAVNGIQSEGVISTLKHYCLNCNETNRHWLDAVIDAGSHRESDLLAFQIAIERSQPGSIMTAYNKINGEYASGNSHLLNDILKGSWAFKGWVMSDWGATRNWNFTLNGLDQESGAQIDKKSWNEEPFVEPLQKAFAEGKFPKERLSDMVRRILRSIYAVGLDKWGPPPKVDLAKHNEIALETARQGIVLLKNDGVLPISHDTTASIAVIGGHAEKGVPIGTGSSAVSPIGGYAAEIKIGGEGTMGVTHNLYLLPSSPLAELKKFLPKAKIEFDPGKNPAEAALLAKRCDIAIVFAIRVEGEGFDSADMTLPWGQDAIIDAVAKANNNTIVVLETGDPVGMPWSNSVKAIIQAWYPGQAGAQAIAEILTGKVNPSGRLPITYPVDISQTPRPELPGVGTPQGTPTTIHYHEGAEVGYRWFYKKNLKPLFPFGHGLSYTSFSYSNFKVIGDDTVTVSFTVTNTGQREGADIPQIYLIETPNEKRIRLIGFERVQLNPGESKNITLTADPRLLAQFDSTKQQWRIVEGKHVIALARDANSFVQKAETRLEGRFFGF